MKKICNGCNQQFDGRRDAKTCTSRCRKRLQRLSSMASKVTHQLSEEVKAVEHSIEESAHRMLENQDGFVNVGYLASNTLSDNLQTQTSPSTSVDDDSVQELQTAEVLPNTAINPEVVETVPLIVQPIPLVIENMTTPVEKGSLVPAEQAYTPKPFKFKYRKYLLPSVRVFALLVVIFALVAFAILKNTAKVQTNWPISSLTPKSVGNIPGAVVQPSDKQLSVIVPATFSKDVAIAGNLTVTKTITQNGFTVCDNSNNCGFGTGNGAITDVNGGIGSIAILGTADQVIVSTLGPNITISTPQNIATTSSPTFAGLNITGNSTVGTVISGIWNGTSLSDTYVDDSLTSSLFVGSGSTTTAIDLATAEVDGILSVSNGGTNSIASPILGGAVYGTGSAYAFTAAGTSGQCLVSSGAGAPAFGSCAGSGSGSDLQAAYDNGNTITGTTGRNISITLADLATDQTLEVTQAGTADAFRVNDDGTFSDSTPFLIDATGNVGIGDTTPTATLTVGNGDLFQVAGATGNVTTSGDIAVNGGDLTSTGALNITPGGALVVGVTTQTATLQGSNTTITSTGTLNIGNNASAQTINIGNSTGATAVSVLCGTGTCGFGNNAIAHTTTIGSVTGTATTNLQGGTGGVNVGTGGIANTVQIGNTTGAVAQTINLGNNATASSATTLLMGSSIGTSTTTLQSGSGGIVIPASLAGTINSSTYLCRNSSNQLTTCLTSGTGAAFVQGGNSFGATASLGTNDSNSLIFETFNATQATIAVGGATTFQNSSDSTSAFAVNRITTSTTPVLTVDTTNSKTILRGINSDATIGSEIIVSQDFTNATYWNNSTGWTETTTTATHTTGNATILTATASNVTVTAGTTYQVGFNIATNTTATNTVTASIGGVSSPAQGSNGSHVVIIAATTTGALTFTPTTNFNGTISNISVRIITTANAVIQVKNSTGTVALEIRASGDISNTFIGLQAGQANSGGFENTGVGSYALFKNTDGFQNTAFGSNALFNNTEGFENTAFGSNALQNNTTGNDNTATGRSALARNTTGSENTSTGAFALEFNTTGSGNNANGYAALSNNTTGNSNTANGNYALGLNTTGSQNTASGRYSLYRNITGSNNTALGYGAGDQDPTITSFVTLNNLQNATALGYGAQVQSSNSLILGGQDANAVNVGIGTTSPTNTLSVSPVQYSTGTASTTASTTVVGVGTTWTSAMVGSEFIFANGAKYTVTGFTSTTQLTLSASSTNASQAYRIHLPALQVTSAGNVGIGDTTPTATLTVGNGDLFQVAGATGNVTTAGDIAVNGGDITSTSAVATLFGANVTTLNVGNASTATYNLAGLTTNGLLKTTGGTGTLAVAVAGTDYQAPLTFNNGLTNTANTVQLGGALIQNTTIDSASNFGITLTSTLSGGARSTYPLVISQANDATNNNTVGLLQLSNLDTGSTVALLNINQASTSGTGISFSSLTGGTSIIVANTGGTSLNANTVTTGTALTATGLSTGNGVALSGTAFTTGNGLLFNTTANALTSGKAINITGSASVISADFTGAYINITPTRTATSGTRTDSGQLINAIRTTNAAGSGGNSSIIDVTGHLAVLQGVYSSSGNPSSSMTISGDILNLSSNCTQTLGTCTDTSNILELAQNYATSTGAVLNLTGAGTGNLAVLDATNTSANGVSIDVQSSSSSQYALDIRSNNGTSRLYVRADGNVGIGDTTPTATLTVGNGDLFQVAGATGNVTTAGDIAVNGGDITSTGALNITPSGALTVGVTTQTALLQGSATSITSSGATNDITLTSADQIILNSTDTIELQDNTNITGNLDVSGTIFAGTGDAFQVSSAGVVSYVDGTADSNTLVCRTSGGQLAACSNAALTGTAFIQGGNSFGQAATLGTNDSFDLQFETAGTTKLTITTGGNLQLAQGANRNIAVAANTTANGAGYNLTMAGGAADGTAAGNIGGSLILRGGNAAGTGNNNGGELLLQGGTRTGTGVSGSVIVRSQTTNSTTAFQVQNTATGTVLNVDTTNNRVGVGTLTPASILDVVADSVVIANFQTSLDTNAASILSLKKSRGTSAVPVIVQVGDNLGSITFNGYDGALYGGSAGISGQVDGTPGLNDRPGRLVFFTTPDGSTTLTERLRIDSSGNVGLGDSSPDAKLDVDATFTPATTGTTSNTASGVNVSNTVVKTADTDTTIGHDVVVIRSGATGGTINTIGTQINVTGDNAGAGTSTTTGLSVTVSGGDNVYSAILQGGNVGIGTATPTSLLHVSSTGTGGLFKITDTTSTAQDVMTIADGGATTFRNQADSTTAFLVQNSAGNNIFGVDTTGTQALLGKASTVTGKLVVYTSANTNTITIQSGTTSTSYTLTLPTAVGASGNCLKASDGSGAMAFGACGTATRKVTLVPEFAGGALTPDGTNNTGTMTSDFCSKGNTNPPDVNTAICATNGDLHNYYSWTANATNDYDIWVKWQVPSDFSSFTSSATGIIKFYGWRTSTSDSVTITAYNNSGSICGTATSIGGTAATWNYTDYPTNSGTCTLTAGTYMTFRVQLSVGVNNEFARMGEIEINYNSL